MCAPHLLVDEVVIPTFTPRATVADSTVAPILTTRGESLDDNASPNAASAGAPTAAIVGGSIATVLIIVLVVLAVLVVQRRKQQPSRVVSKVDLDLNSSTLTTRTNSDSSRHSLHSVTTPWSTAAGGTTSNVYDNAAQMEETQLSSFSMDAVPTAVTAAAAPIWEPKDAPYDSRRPSVRLSDNNVDPEDA